MEYYNVNMRITVLSSREEFEVLMYDLAELLHNNELPIEGSIEGSGITIEAKTCT